MLRKREKGKDKMSYRSPEWSGNLFILLIQKQALNILYFPFYPLPDKKGALLARAPRIGVGISVCLSDFIVQCAGDDFILFRI